MADDETLPVASEVEQPGAIEPGSDLVVTEQPAEPAPETAPEPITEEVADPLPADITPPWGDHPDPLQWVFDHFSSVVRDLHKKFS